MSGKRYADEYYWSEKRKILSPKELQVPGLDVFGYCVFDKAYLPLIPHCHGNSYEFSILTTGHQVYCDEKREYSLTGGSVFITFPFEEHSSGNLPDEKKELYWFRLDMDEKDGLMGLSPRFSRLLYEEVQSLKNRTLRLSADGQKLLKTAFEYFCLQTDYSRCMGTAVLLNILRQIIEADKKLSDGECSDKMRTITAFIDRNIGENFDLNDLAERCGLSLSRFKQRFAAEIGMPPREYINFVKINKAKELLLEPGTSVTDVAFRLGYASSNYFTVVFKRVALITPSAYIERSRSR